MKFFHLKINQFKKIEHLKSKINLIKNPIYAIKKRNIFFIKEKLNNRMEHKTDIQIFQEKYVKYTVFSLTKTYLLMAHW